MLKPKRTIRVGVIGVGSMGQHHARIYSSLPEVELVGICDHSRERLYELSRKYDTKPFTDYRRLISEVEAVSIATQTENHYEVGMACMEAGVHVLMEKPLARTVDEGEGMVQAAARQGVIFQVGHVERFNPAVQQLLTILKREQPLAIEARRLSPPIPRGNDVSVVFDLMTHDIDLVLAIAQSPVKTMNSLGVKINNDNLNYVNAQILFQNGLVATLSASKVTERKVRMLEVTCEKSYLEVDLMQKTLTIHRRTSSGYRTRADQVYFTEEESSEKVLVPTVEPLHEELSTFIRSIITGQSHGVTAAEGLEVIKMATEIERLALRKRLFQLIDV